MFLKDKNILFIHIPKTAGKLITNNLFKNSDDICYGHYPFKIWQDKYKSINNSTIIFTFVRNPWDKMVSLYHYSLKYDRNIVCWFSQIDEIDFDFNKWLKWNYNDNINVLKTTKITPETTNNIEMISDFELNFFNQLNLLTDNDNNKNDDITIFKFEDFKKSTKNIKEFFKNNNLNIYDFSKIVNSVNHKHYSEYYNDESKKLIEKYFSIDITFFNYIF